jgi:SCY1-like protein 1
MSSDSRGSKAAELNLLTQPDTVIPENASNGQTYGPSTTTMLNGSYSAAAGSSLVNSATGAAGALAGWAIASLGKQLPVSEAHSSIAVTPAQVQEPLSVQRTPSDIFQSASMPLEQSSAGPSRSNTPSQASRLAPARKAGGMQLGGAGVGARAGAGKTGLSSSWMDELSGEFEQDEVADAWGSGDLMDVNADGDDWSEYESSLRKIGELTQ